MKQQERFGNQESVSGEFSFERRTTQYKYKHNIEVYPDLFLDHKVQLRLKVPGRQANMPRGQAPMQRGRTNCESIISAVEPV